MKKHEGKGQNVLLVTEYFPPHWTGISKAFYFLGKNLVSQGHKATVLTTQFDQSLLTEDVIDNIKIVRSAYQLRISRTHYSFTILLKFLTIVGMYDTVVINSPNSNIFFFSLLTKLAGRKLIIFHQGDLKLPRQTGNIIVNFLFERVFDILTIPSVLLSDVISTYTEDYARNSRVLKYGLYKFRPFVPFFELPRGKSKAAFVKKLAGIKKRGHLVGFAGRFVEEKGYDILLQAIPLVKKRVPKVVFVFAGKKKIDYEPFYEKHKKLIDRNKQNVVFLGLLEDGDLTHFYDSLDLFVISSRSDCFPTTQIEVVQKHVPIVVTDIPGARMLVKETGFGEIAEREDPQSLADAIVVALDNRKNNVYRQNQKKVSTFFKKYGTFDIS